MTKRIVNWKPVRTKNIYGEEFVDSDFPILISRAYRGTLLSEILSMPQKNPISFAGAVNLAQYESFKAFQSGQIGRETGQTIWYYKNFIQWISEQGYHIELTGDEFEGQALSDQIS